MGWKDGQGVGQRVDARKMFRMKAAARARAIRHAMKVGWARHARGWPERGNNRATTATTRMRT